MTVIMSANDLRRRLLKMLAILLAAATLLGITAYAEGETAEETTAAETTTDDTYKELQSQYDKLENQMSENQEKLDKVQSDMDKQEQVVDGIGNKIDDTQNQVPHYIKPFQSTNLLIYLHRYIQPTIDFHSDDM